jgi:hypothetical protein
LALALTVVGAGCASDASAPSGAGGATGGSVNAAGSAGMSAAIGGRDASGGAENGAAGSVNGGRGGSPASAGTVGSGGHSDGGLGGAVSAAGRGGGRCCGPGGATAMGGAGGRSNTGGAAGASGGRTAGSGGMNSAGNGAGGMSGKAGSAGTGGAGMLSGPCDIYAAGNTPCVAAHSTVRALLAAYAGKLYQVKRASDNTTLDIGVLAPGGFADAAAQDAFCTGTTCTIPIIYDQAGKGNDLTVAPAGGNGSADVAASATGQKLTVGGNTVYAIYVAAGVGYRNNKTTGVATGTAAEGEYMVASGKHVNDGCCFDYGNAETNSKDNGNGHMEAIYLGKLCWFTPCNGSGPWVMADLENGLFAGGNGTTSSNTSVAYDYVTALLKGDSSHYAIKGGNSQTGELKTMYSGGLPTTSGYNPMHKEGAIILGIGGDNSKVAVGTFFEGAMTSGYPSDATEDAVQANVVAAGYGH